jgi:SulP family sulfate permease
VSNRNTNKYLEFGSVDLSALASTIPTMFALSFFGIIHVPINVPALGAAVKEDNLNVNRELIAHGISNTLSGLVGSIQVCNTHTIAISYD